MRFHDRYYRIARYIFTQRLSPIKDPMHIFETRWKKVCRQSDRVESQKSNLIKSMISDRRKLCSGLSNRLEETGEGRKKIRKIYIASTASIIMRGSYNGIDAIFDGRLI